MTSTTPSSAAEARKKVRTETTQSTPPSGKLQASLKIPSQKLQQSLPIEVRDSRLALVSTLQSGETLDLSPGWYEVSAVLDDGQRHSETVQVTVDETKHVQFQIDSDTLLPTSELFGPSSMTRAMNPTSLNAMLDNDVTFLGSEEAQLVEKSVERWIFEPQRQNPVSMPTAHLKIDGVELSVSLPVNPRGHSGLAACVMTFDRRSYGIDVRAGFHPERRVSTAIHNMVEKGQFAHATIAAEQTAKDMLRSKYRDPVGAALGAIIMYRAGTLGSRSDWLRNLARGFGWLADGKILLALLPEVTDEAETASLLLEASQQRPLFTESFSLLFDALRRWPSDHRQDEISQALQRVATLAKQTEWSAFTLTTRTP